MHEGYAWRDPMSILRPTFQDSSRNLCLILHVAPDSHRKNSVMRRRSRSPGVIDRNANREIHPAIRHVLDRQRL